MKIIITEEQFKTLQESDNDFKKTKSLLLSMLEKDYSVDDIKKLTGLGYDIIILCLKYEKIIKEKGNCKEIHDFLYNYLWMHTDLINKKYFYDDGSKIYLDFDTMSGSVDFDYINAEGHRLFGYATFLWGGECEWPLDGEECTMGQKKPLNYNEYYGNIDYMEYYDEFKNIQSFDDIIKFFNNHYFELIKDPIEYLIEKYIIEYYD